jgi:hypothetical protein
MMHFLVIDNRFGTPIHVFLEFAPEDETNELGLSVQDVKIDLFGPEKREGRRSVLGQDPRSRNQFREFVSEEAVDNSGYVLVEPYFMGPTWGEYVRGFRPQGKSANKRRDKMETSSLKTAR